MGVQKRTGSGLAIKHRVVSGHAVDSLGVGLGSSIEIHIALINGEKTMNTLKTGLLATVTTLALSSTALAATLEPSDVIFPLGDTAATAPNTIGDVLNDNLINFTFDISQFFVVGGNVQNRAYESGELTTMVFAPRIRDTFNIAFANGFEITAFRLDGYAGWDTDVGYRTDSLGDDGPSSVSRSNDGDTLTFRYADTLFIDGLAPGVQEESLFPYIVTDAPNYELTGSMTLFGHEAGDPTNSFQTTITGMAVPSAVPIPAAVWLFGSGLIGLIGIARRRKQVV